MKNKVAEGRVIKALKEFEGIDIGCGGIDDAKEAIKLILNLTETSKKKEYEGLKEILVSSVVEHSTTAMEHQTHYIIEFVIEDENHLEMVIQLIRELQEIFRS